MLYVKSKEVCQDLHIDGEFPIYSGFKLLGGKSNIGKSTLGNALSSPGVYHVSLDHVI